MNITNKLQIFRNKKTSNTKKMLKMLQLSVQRIRAQGSGCIIPKYGTAYIDKIGRTKDSITILTALNSYDLKNTYGLISDEAQKPFVQYLIREFKIDITSDTEYNRFVVFLQELQDAHDRSFDPHYNESAGMNSFLQMTDTIRQNIDLIHIL